MKKLSAFMLTLAIMAAMSISALAAETDVASLMTSGVENVQSDIMSVIGVVLPVLIAITATIIGIRFGLRFIKKIGSA